MRCHACGHPNSRVTDSRETDSAIRRRRECRQCGVRFTTYERVHSTALMIAKQDSRREEFDREKLVSGIRKACAKRPIPSRSIEKMAEDIETEILRLGQGEVSSKYIGAMVMDRLKNLDRVAYIRYASVYRDFQDIESFERVVRDLREDNTQLSLPDIGPDAPRRQRRRQTRPMNRQPESTLNQDA